MLPCHPCFPSAKTGPSNRWAEERSWVLGADHGLWAAKVAGSERLVRLLVGRLVGRRARSRTPALGALRPGGTRSPVPAS
ncbi:hypothetical protein [Streptomyces sp. G-G2]|uniref:hypothetical protein n=1 Tax=Streptomyces sp. G-G2 TaxID=3046201 RepID=UPI0024BBAF90|nr:hypothetical protein [Streptomyces sp. G-G2]MDJ0383072.1 hypothetical protein [Streptomyces sp. G-G2]